MSDRPDGKSSDLFGVTNKIILEAPPVISDQVDSPPFPSIKESKPDKTSLMIKCLYCKEIHISHLSNSLGTYCSSECELAVKVDQIDKYCVTSSTIPTSVGYDLTAFIKIEGLDKIQRLLSFAFLALSTDLAG